MNNIKTCVLASCVMLCAVASADNDANAATETKSKMTSEERIAQLGGFVTYPGSQKGQVVFVDTQKSVDVAKSFEEVFSHFRHQVPVRIELSKAEPGSPLKLKSDAKADFVVVFVDDATQPSLSVVPDDGYAIVNFAKYKTGLKFPDDEAMYKKRCAKAALRAFAMLCGGCGSRYPGHVMAAHGVQELDFAQEKLPIDIQDSIKKYLGAAGVTPLRRTIYRRACQEGWAPAPTNDAQKAIWDKVHELPTEPIKIKPEKKKVSK